MAAHPGSRYPRVVAGRVYLSRRALAAALGREFGRQRSAVCSMLQRYEDDAARVALAYLGREIRHDEGRWKNRAQFYRFVADRSGVTPAVVRRWWRRTPSPAAVIERAERLVAAREPGRPGI